MMTRKDEVDEIAHDMFTAMVDGRYSEDGGLAQAAGLEFRVLHNGGRLEMEYQFADKAGTERIEREVLAEVACIILRRLVGKTAE
jgi:hypothetical protein